MTEGSVSLRWPTAALNGCTVDCMQRCLYTGSPSWQIIDGCMCNGLMSTELSKLIGTFSNEWCFSLWDHDDRIHVWCYSNQCCFPECIIEWHSGWTPRILVWGVIFILWRSNLLRIEGNLNSNKYVYEVLLPEVIPLLQASLELSFCWIIHAHMCQRLFETSVQPYTCSFFLGLLIHCICCLLSMRGIWLVGVSLVICVLQLQKMNFGCTYNQYGITFHKQAFKIYTKCWFRTLFFSLKNPSHICTNTSRLCFEFHLILIIP